MRAYSPLWSALISSGAALVALGAAPALAAPNVVVSIKPLHALVSGVMDGVATPDLLVAGAQSPHGFALRPSDAATLEGADLVFWIGSELETFLSDPLQTLAADATAVAMIDIAGMDVLEARDGGLFEAHSHDEHAHEGEDDDDHGDEDDEGSGREDHDHVVDAHLWLDPDNARLMVAAIAETLIAADPENAATYNANGAALAREISDLDAEIVTRLEGLGEAAWFVFHDAYHSFEAHYDIEATGSFTINPEIAPGAARLIEIRDTVAAVGGACIFAEPQFSPSVIETIAGETGAALGTLDPLGAELEPGRDLYFTMMRTLADNLATCLSAN